MKKILIIKMRFPYPLFAGTDHVSYNLIKVLSQKHEVSLICHVRSEENKKDVSELKKYCKTIITAQYPTYRSFAHRLWHKIKREFLFLFCFIPRDVSDNLTSDIEKKIKSHLKENEYDLVQIEYYYASKFAKYIKNSTSVMLSNDAYYETIRQIGAYEKRLIKRAIRYFEYFVTKRYEIKSCNNFDWVFFISSHDIEVLKKSVTLDRTKLIPVIMDINAPKDAPAPEENTMIFVGGMHAFFNRDAVLYFCKDIFPLILSENPQAKFIIVGSAEGTEIVELGKHPNITVTGAVSDVKPHILQSALYVAPLRIGTGIKTKILEAMALKKAIVTTSVGVQGLKVENNVNISIENEPEKFAAKVLQLLDNRQLCEKMGERAEVYFRENHKLDYASDKLLEAYDAVLNEK